MHHAAGIYSLGKENQIAQNLSSLGNTQKWIFAVSTKSDQATRFQREKKLNKIMFEDCDVIS